MREPGEALEVQRDAGGCPLAALALYLEQVDLGLREPIEVETDLIGVAAAWERATETSEISVGKDAPPAREWHAGPCIARAYVTGKSPRTKRGRRKRDLKYLWDVANEAARTLDSQLAMAYVDLAVEWGDRHKARRGFRWLFKL